MENLRFKIAVLRSAPKGLWQVYRANKMIADKERYSEEERFAYAKKIMDGIRKNTRTVTKVYGKENLPVDENYVLYSNHQGKYDALGILTNLDRPTSVLFALPQAKRIMARQVCGLVDAVTIDLQDMRDAVRAIRDINMLLKNGKSILVFPEGRYEDNRNNLLEFQTGVFSCNLKTGKPIVPVVIYDSWKAMNTNSYEKVETQVHFLKPIYSDEFKGMKKAELADLVKSRISEKLEEIGKYKKI